VTPSATLRMRPESDGFASNGGDHQWMRRSDAAAQGGFTTVHARKEGDGGQMSDIACRKTPNTPPLRLSPHFSKVFGVGRLQFRGSCFRRSGTSGWLPEIERSMTKRKLSPPHFPVARESELI
jgi:hypothetical protein